MLIPATALLATSLLTACDLADRITGTKAQAAHPQCVRGSVTFTPETTLVATDTPDTYIVEITYVAHICGRPKGYPG